MTKRDFIKFKQLIDLEINQALDFYRKLCELSGTSRPIIEDALNFYKRWFPVYYGFKSISYEIKRRVGPLL